MLKIGKNLIRGENCELEATPFKATFKGGERVLIPAEAGVIIGDNVTLGSHVIINRGVSRPTILEDSVYVWHKSVIGHDSIIKHHACLGVDCDVSGEVEIGSYTYIGVGSVISPRVKIGSYCMIGAGSNVTHDTVIKDGEVWFGNPAKRIKDNSWRPPQ
jgi:UDP-3-O-[3-hydroxymyristoyl] glucosamine N-acyltransferase